MIDLFGFKKTRELQNVAKLFAEQIAGCFKKTETAKMITCEQFKVVISMINKKLATDYDNNKIFKMVATEMQNFNIVTVKTVDNQIYFLKVK